jgi:hypothetical protein
VLDKLTGCTNERSQEGKHAERGKGSALLKRLTEATASAHSRCGALLVSWSGKRHTELLDKLTCCTERSQSDDCCVSSRKDEGKNAERGKGSALLNRLTEATASAHSRCGALLVGWCMEEPPVKRTRLETWAGWFTDTEDPLGALFRRLMVSCFLGVLFRLKTPWLAEPRVAISFREFEV